MMMKCNHHFQFGRNVSQVIRNEKVHESPCPQAKSILATQLTISKEFRSHKFDPLVIHLQLSKILFLQFVHEIVYQRSLSMIHDCRNE